MIDGDTIEIAGETIRLWGIDAPEAGQPCRRAGGLYPCGQDAAAALEGWLSLSTVYCAPQGRPDRYGRTVARCTAQISVDHLTSTIPDLGAELVRRGHAMDYHRFSGGAFAAEQSEARQARRGIWAGEFTPPWEWRELRREASNDESAPASGCRIKGNINRDGERIYHSPGMRSWAGARIDESAGERWFCSEEEARSAGWRAPRGQIAE
ncbi:thermonuclease family protein [Brevundimonas sp.]|uniref:thermonuclease family protein n=1 Tax=Brevundimonas sp. TaxID=1871086 RepID=UPI0039E4F878